MYDNRLYSIIYGRVRCTEQTLQCSRYDNNSEACRVTTRTGNGDNFLLK